MIRDLVTVEFEDRTSYNMYDTSDIVGVIIRHCWGPAGKLQVLNKRQFLEYYPESVPFYVKDVVNIDEKTGNVPYAYMLANALRCFDKGASQLEVERYDDTKGNRWIAFSTLANTAIASAEDPLATLEVIGSSGGSATECNPESAIEGFNITVGSSTKPQFIVYLKYPGVPPKSLLPYDDMEIVITPSAGGVLNIQVVGVLKSGDGDVKTILESWYGGIDPQQIVDGKSFFIENIVNDSDFIKVKCDLSSDNKIFNLPLTATTKSITYSLCGTLGSVPYSYTYLNQYTESTIASEYTKCFGPRRGSNATVLVATDKNINTYVAIQNIAASRMNCTAVVGSDQFKETQSLAQTYMNQSLIRDKFSYYLNAEEAVTIFGKRIILDGTCGYVGRLCSKAASVSINQLPSADSNGAYSGAVLTKSWDYETVINAHELGINSIYNSNNGVQIFGIRSMHERQYSYYGKFNVSRVLAAILKQVYSEIDYDIHTEVVSDDVARSNATTRLNNILQSFAPKCIKSQSVAYIESDDKLTMGGENLIVTLEIWFKKLAERAIIKVVATDSSVTTEIS